MNDFNRCNKVPGVYWLKKDVRDLQIRIKLKRQESIISLPKFEDCTNGSNVLKLENNTEEYSFKWQEKIFSIWEVQRYSDVHNCITEAELIYHEGIDNIEYKPGKVFTYVHEDYYLPLPIDCNKKEDGLLTLLMEKLKLNDSLDKAFVGDTVSTTVLFKSEENVSGQEQWTAMHVVFDNSDYNEDSQLIYKQELTLLSIYHNTAHNYIIMMPDVNNLELNPYTLETTAGVPWGYQYGIEMDFDCESGEELVLLLKKLHKRWEKKQKHLLNFVMPPVGKKQYCVAIEILSAVDFDMDNLYIQFDIKVPEDIQCTDTLQGKTHTSESVMVEGEKIWSYSHIIELCLEVNTGIEPPPIKLFLEVISSDWWDRHRTEGYCFLPLHLNPGCYAKELVCSRPEETDVVEAESRRFFLGGCHLIKDLNVLAEPLLQDTNYTFTTTGSINLRWNIISQAQIGGLVAPPAQPGTSTASALLLGAEAALKKYKKARARLAAATKDLSEVQYGAGDR
ncbi:Meckel syndrome type 1 protein-like [Helicoverpa zea]|uniref:Meckel syndrome type 1 protein-like n=1 Tax=Helicoverpa zea TaxID=7113 RepID=UPI001F595A52|nr:Meckel syndrome type 1 protein-like [Helicoverpa zea]